MFVPDDGKVLVSADLAQAESRVVAYLAEEEEMMACFQRGDDIHLLTKQSLPPGFKPPHTYDVEDPLRYFAKRHTHAFTYGETAFGLASLSGLPLTTCKEIRNAYFTRFPNVLKWQADIEAHLYKNRVMVTPLCRKRMFFGRIGSELFKEAYAYVPQSTVGDILNLALIRIDSLIEKRKMDVQLLLQVHDSFVLQCKQSDVVEVKELLMEAFHIPITIKGRTFVIPYDVKIGINWEEL